MAISLLFSEAKKITGKKTLTSWRYTFDKDQQQTLTLSCFPLHASSLQTKQAVSLFAAGVVALSASPALALNAIELQDNRAANKNGLQLIYEVSIVRSCIPHLSCFFLDFCDLLWFFAIYLSLFWP